MRDALVRVLEHKPFNDVTVDELAREAGLSRTAFYFYYKDKNEVLGAVLEGLPRHRRRAGGGVVERRGRARGDDPGHADA